MTRRVSVVGAGDMGHGFAALFTLKGQDVTLIDHRQSNLEEARERIHDAAAFLDREGLAEGDPEAVVEAIEYTLDREAGVADADLVLESVPEELDLKRDVFGSLAAAAPGDAVLASNTSGLPITDIATGAPDAAERIVGCHWWYPPYLLRPVEVVRGEETSEGTMNRLAAFVEDVDRDPIRVEKDVPGFVWNRVQFAVYRECLHLAEQGVASIDDINRAIRDGYATRTAAIGPFETADIAGLDLVETVGENLLPELSNATTPSDLFEERLSEGRGGIEDGAGFFEYDDPPEAITGRRDGKVAAIRRALED